MRDSAGNDESEARHDRVETRRMVKAVEELVERVQELVEEKLEKACPEAWKSQCEEDARGEAERVIRNAAGEIHKEYASCDLRCEKLEDSVKTPCD